jgi:hypothetical protein
MDYTQNSSSLNLLNYVTIVFWESMVDFSNTEPVININWAKWLELGRSIEYYKLISYYLNYISSKTFCLCSGCTCTIVKIPSQQYIMYINKWL